MHEHVYELDTSDPFVDVAVCECNEVKEGYSFNKVVSADRQELLLTAEGLSISLEGVSAYTEVKDVYVVKKEAVQVDGEWTTVVTNFSLGTDPSSLDVSSILEEKQLHGENNIVVIVSDEMGDHEISVPVLMVTAEISSLEGWKAALQTAEETGATYGYYVLADNIDAGSEEVGNPVACQTTTGGENGFRGTLDGRGHTFSNEGAQTATFGLFGGIGSGAVIKNITFTNTGMSCGYNFYYFGKHVTGATFTDVIINLNDVANNAGTVYGELAYNGFQSCTLTNVVFNIDGHVDSLFGGGANALLGFQNNVFTDCIINLAKGASMTEIGHCGDPSNGATVYTAEGLEVEGAELVDGIIVKEYKVVSLAERQSLLMTDETFSISLGEYADYAIKSITLGELDLGTDVSALNFAEAQNDPSVHGMQDITVIVENDGAEMEIAVPVLMITAEISTYDAWKAAIQPTTDGEQVAKYGYYVLTDNIDAGGVVTVANAQDTTGGAYGFCGTIDGQNYTVTYSTGKNGIFGTLGSGAVVKNITFTDNACAPRYEGGSAVSFARLISGTTFDNVTINLNNCALTTIDGYGALTYQGVQNCSFNNVTINVQGEVDSLLGGASGSYWGFKNTTFTNCFIIIAKNTTIKEVANQDTTIYTVAGLDVEGATVLEGIVAQYTYVMLKNNQDIMMENATYALDLGEYADYAISSIKLGEIEIGTDASALNIPDEIKNDKTKHGEYLVSVLASKNDMEIEIVIPVTLVTKAISTMQDLNTTVACVDADIYGYYILTNNVSFTETGFAPVTNAKRGWASTVAFKGTLNGRGYTVAANSSQWGNVGLFGTMNGATVKNITITDGWNNGSALLAYAAYNVTFTDVNIEIKNGAANSGVAGSMSLFANAFGGNGSFTNVNIKTSIDMPVLLPGMTAWIKFSNVTITGNVTNLSLTAGYEKFDAVTGITVNAA